MAKRCSTCKTWKVIGAFPRNRSHHDGLSNQCKDCHHDARRAYREKDRERTRRKSREHYSRTAEAQRARAARYKLENPEKNAAHNAVSLAVARGDLARPAACTECGIEGVQVQAHHEDYSKPLEVRWLCQRCHWQAHGFSSELYWRRAVDSIPGGDGLEGERA